MNRKKKECKKKISIKSLGNCDNGVCPIDKPKKKTKDTTNQSLNLAIQSWQDVISECEAIRTKRND